jgi:hypothetical protein
VRHACEAPADPRAPVHAPAPLLWPHGRWLWYCRLPQVLVGPGSPRPAQPISPPEVAAFVESARAGLVLVATGTLPLARLLLSATDMRQLAQGFALLAPTRVLWAIKPQHLPEGVTLAELTGGSDNIKFTPWVDYNVRAGREGGASVCVLAVGHALRHRCSRCSHHHHHHPQMPCTRAHTHIHTHTPHHAGCAGPPQHAPLCLALRLAQRQRSSVPRSARRGDPLPV